MYVYSFKLLLLLFVFSFYYFFPVQGYKLSTQFLIVYIIKSLLYYYYNIMLYNFYFGFV